MQIVIDIDEKIYNEYMNLATGRIPTYKACDIAWVLKNGTILPKGHGRLIDADKLKEQDFGDNYYTIKAEIDRADTIVKADRPKILYKDRWYNGLAN